MPENGILYIVATPIGNLNDLSPRAKEVLSSVDAILCEDTRHSSTLFSAFGIKKPLLAYHDHNERNIAQNIIAQLQEGKNLALVSDAGTPLISDPGYYLTSLCHEHNIKVSPIPGSCAFVAALSASGMPSDSFTFYGFLPAKSKQRQEKLEQIKQSEATAIFYESTHRIKDTLADIITVLGQERKICLARELTKQFETIVTTSAQGIKEYLESNSDHCRGEFVLIIQGCSQKQEASLTPEIENLIKELASELPPKKVAKIVANCFKLDKKEIYNYLISQK
ncbi:16S rRNA (cytidine(1402)-2'-O)-methyltransferase [Psittacicella melopsittaci]|uniref:Ribosomal RNA small subunit methyltransferase I n=1 Tax=Psittacicella melopsittaci TaxID=2028576 RepID=A0A3A1Y2W7_9GAMM|nr:16S rRNA (cytidine(1402)-2'-O)-methyltransferase [Psittacicella melopsittaci]RIY31770.1 16S rRNA (cytidine(1402)-2'-O)-methyltransferase [Psittacicella melopsittaci]